MTELTKSSLKAWPEDAMFFFVFCFFSGCGVFTQGKNTYARNWGLNGRGRLLEGDIYLGTYGIYIYGTNHYNNIVLVAERDKLVG